MHKVLVDNTTPPPLNYIHFAHHSDTSSTIPTVSSSSINVSQSRQRHFPLQKKTALNPPQPPPSQFHQLTNMCWLTITHCIVNEPSLREPSSTIDTDLSTFLLEICDVKYTKLPSLLAVGINSMHQIATLRPNILCQHELANFRFQHEIEALNWWAQRHHLRSKDLFNLTSPSFGAIVTLYANSSIKRTQRTHGNSH